MVFKTLQWYIIRELLRIFVLTASALTTLMAFGGTFRPFTKRGIEIIQLLVIMFNLMPAMLAYAIPIAALFAAVLVYWRLSTDNELTACRASGISFVTIVAPALVLGLVVASVDLVFVNYVVPVFLQRTERAITSDLGSLLVSQIGRQETYKIGSWVVYADGAHQEDTSDPNSVRVILDGMAATTLKNGRPTRIVIARQAIVTITTSASDEAGGEATVKLVDASAFDEPKLQRVSGSIDSLTGQDHLIIPSLLKSKPKFLNVKTLFEYERDPTGFQPVREVIGKIALAYQYQEIGAQLLGAWRSASAGQNPLIFQVRGIMPGTVDELRIFAPFATLDAEKQLVFVGIPAKPELHQAAKPVRIEEYNGRRLELTYTCLRGTLNLAPDQLSSNAISASLELTGEVTRTNHIQKIGPDATGNVDLPGVMLPAEMTTVALPPPADLLELAQKSASPTMQARSFEAVDQIHRLFHTILSELNSRGSFAVSCLTLVLLGAALGILLKGKNPLAVFVVGFVPAIVLVLLITAGRQLTEGGSDRNVPIGVGLIWAGNAVLLVLLMGVYAKLLRH